MKFSVHKTCRTIALLAAILITGCGGENTFTGGGCNPADTVTNIQSFSVVGSTTDAGTEVINDSADFTLSWDLTSSCTYTYKLYLAATNAQLPIDVEIASGTCGLGRGCSYDADVSCSFDAMNKTISCGTGGAITVSSLLPDPGPAMPYFILEASNEMMDSDVMISDQVRIDF